MKKLLVLLFSILISFNSWGETICVETDTQVRDGIIYLTTSDGVEPFTGKDVCKYENGQKESESSYKDDNLISKTYYHENGQKESESSYKDGKKHGKVTWWDEKGQINVEATYKDDNLISQTDYYYYENGQIRTEENYKDGKLDGVYNSWYENGQKKVEAYFKDGKYTKWTEWRKNGKKKWNCWGLC